MCVIDIPGGWIKKPFWAKFWQRPQKFKTFITHHEIVGESIRLGDHVFKVIGTLQNPPRDKDPRWFRSFSGGSGTVYVPITTFQRFLARATGDADPERVENIEVDTGDEKTVPVAKRVIEGVLKTRHRGEVDYRIRDFRETIQEILNRTRQYAIAVLTVGVVAILAGGIGIMNVTLATIFSRIREIGIRRAVGATRADILFQFVTEAMLLGLLGGIAGIALGLLGLHKLSPRGSEEVVQALVWWHFLATLGISVGAGFVFSIYPAYQASKLDPVEALRYE